MPEASPNVDRRSKPTETYTIHIGAPLGVEWGEWFADSAFLARDDGTGLITAKVRDQAMLFGVLLRIRDLGIPLLGVYPGHCSAEPDSTSPGLEISTPAEFLNKEIDHAE